MGEKFAANPATGTGSMSVPIAVSPGRSGFGPQLSLSYDSGSGNGPFGFGWSHTLPQVTRGTNKGLPRYRDAEESDVFILSGTEDLVPVLQPDGSRFEETIIVDGDTYTVHRYRPRVEGLFARIERWTHQPDGDIHWRSISRENILTLYGKDTNSRIADPEAPAHIFTWLICETRDDRGNAVVYEYQSEDSVGVDAGMANERNRTLLTRSANRYLKRIQYGNRNPLLDADGHRPPFLTQAMQETVNWLFEVVFDYDEAHSEELPLDPSLSETEQHRFVLASADPGLPWSVRPDPFSAYRAGFEVRTYRRCHRVLMFHRFDELGTEPYLVRCTEFEYADLDYMQGVDIDAELTHQGSTRFASFIHAVSQYGYVRNETPAVQRNGVLYSTYLRKSLPPLEFQYSKAVIQEDVREMDAESLENLPSGLDGGSYQWVDFDGEGVSGVLTEQAGAWFYKPNLGDARFGPLQQVARRPSLAAISRGRQQLLDLAGDGQLDLVELNGPTPGFYERNDGEDWENFRAFESLPNLPWGDPNLRFVDLTGDGHADILITEDEALSWYPSLGEEGFGPAERVQHALDEDRGPRLILADSTQSVFLADLSGDGLTDLARIRNGEVCYWPNLGYGRFGAKVTMDSPPWFDTLDQFDPRHIRLADVDGSGTTDIMYLGRDGIRLYFNQSGNRWTGGRLLASFPAVDNLASVSAVDLLGNGTACLVWSSPLPGADSRSVRYIDLMGAGKPHLLVKVTNNLGAETLVEYAPSTKFYLADKSSGKPWITRLPFPVHVVERVETYDWISRNRFVTRYAYHHGFFDGEEREFRGFGLVEQKDTEEFAALSENGPFPLSDNIEEASHVSPVYTRAWFHTGIYLGRDRVSNFFAGLVDEDDVGEYYREPGLTDIDAQALLLPDTVLPDGLSPEEEREACRALKGLTLRQEVFGLDGAAMQAHPYTVVEQNFTVRVLQPKGPNRHAVFFTHPREAITFHYERSPTDPRVGHRITLEVDGFGNVLKEANVGCGRRKPDMSLDLDDRAKQTQRFATYSENLFSNAIDVADAYRTPLPCETRTYELTGYQPTGAADRFRPSDLVEPDPTNPQRLAHVLDSEIDYWDQPTNGRQRRLIEQMRTLYRKDDLTNLLGVGAVESLGLAGETYKLAFTPALLAHVFWRNGQPLLLDPAGVLGGTGPDQGGYEDLDGDGRWWIPGGRVYLSVDPSHEADQELAYARGHFFLPQRYQDAFSHTWTVVHDAHDLLLLETRDPLDNRITAGERRPDGTIDPARPGNDYRVLQPRLVMDANRNRAAVAFDPLGLVVGTAVMAKPEESQGDSLDGFGAVLTEAVAIEQLESPVADPQAVLGGATTRITYDLFAYHRTQDQPNPQAPVVHTLARETHDADLLHGQQTKVQRSFSYSDGFGREIQKKIQAEPGSVPQRDADGKILVGADGQPLMTANDVSPRWVGSAWTVFNNKGNPVRQYEPFFSDTHRFEFDLRIGVSPVLFYDPVERLVGTLHPNHTLEKVIFDPWRQETWDVNDSVLLTNPKADANLGPFFRRLPEADYMPTWHTQRQGGALGAEEQDAARRAAVHADTPTVAHADSLGRTFLTIAHNRLIYSDTQPGDPPIEEFHPTRTVFDIEGNRREVIDAIERIVMRCDYDLLGNLIHRASMEAGERWILNDVAGNPLCVWDGRDHRFRNVYDPLRRPTASLIREGAGTELLAERTIYGESRPSPEENNLRGRVVQLFDQAGMVTSEEYDFKGNLLKSQRHYAQAYKTTLDWSTAVALEDGTYGSRTRYDALNRPIEQTSPDNSVVRRVYNEANLLNRLDANLRGANQDGELVWTPFVVDIDYDARGQRTTIDYANGVRTTYEYDPLTHRLLHLLTRRDAPAFPQDCPQPLLAIWPGCDVQNLHYTYDPVGNITHIRDDAQQTIYFRNKRVEPSADNTYDALYRLIEATGREHLGQVGGSPIPHSYNDAPRVGLLHPNDGTAMGTYVERYIYDAVGNFLQMRHQSPDPAVSGWTRLYHYEESSQLETGKQNNRLTSTTIGGMTELYSTDGEGYDAHGNMPRMSQLHIMKWDSKDQLQMTQRQAVNATDTEGLQRQGERTWYVYDISGYRARKVTELASGQVKDERLYLGGFEIYRKEGANSLVRETLSVFGEGQRVALIETRTQGDDLSPQQLIRYQYGNHLGSTSLEVDDHAQIISYEEYTPYGCSSYQATPNQTICAKRYRYTEKERDEESGLYYHGARYFAPWLGRWTAADPAGLVAGTNLYAYAGGNPVNRTDPSGTQERRIEGETTIRLVNKQTGKLETVEHTRWVTLPEVKVEGERPALIPEPLPGGEPKQEASAAPSVMTKIGWGLRFAFVLATNQTPEQFGQGMVDKAKSLTLDPVMTLYGPGGMIDKAAQKAVDRALGSKPPDEGYVTKEEHAKQLGAIVAVAGSLAPGLGGPVLQEMGPALVTPEGALVIAPTQAAASDVGRLGTVALSVGGSTGNKPSEREKVAAVRETEDYKVIARRYDREKFLLAETGRFAEFTREEVVRDVNIGVLRGSRQADFKAANELAGFQSTPKGYVWHHHQDLGRMQLVRVSAHAADTGHLGGVAIWERMLGLRPGTY